MACVSGNPILNDEEFDQLKLKLKVLSHSKYTYPHSSELQFLRILSASIDSEIVCEGPRCSLGMCYYCSVMIRLYVLYVLAFNLLLFWHFSYDDTFCFFGSSYRLYHLTIRDSSRKLLISSLCVSASDHLFPTVRLFRKSLLTMSSWLFTVLLFCGYFKTKWYIDCIVSLVYYVNCILSSRALRAFYLLCIMWIVFLCIMSPRLVKNL